MTPLTLVMTNPAGEELGRIALPGYAVCAAGEGNPTGVPDLRREMDGLRHEVEARIAGEEMELAVGPVDALIAISRALLTADASPEVRITLPVRPAARKDPGTQQDLNSTGDLDAGPETDARQSGEPASEREPENDTGLFADLFTEVAEETEKEER